MGIRFSAGEVLAVAEQIERNGATFYEAAAEQAVTAEVQKMLRDLSQWESGHQALFASMREQLSDREREAVTYDPDDQLAGYLSAVADTQVFSRARTGADLLGGQQDEAAMIRKAIALEHESIAFYMSMRPLVPPRLGQAHLDTVVLEEYGHVAQLTARLAAVR